MNRTLQKYAGVLVGLAWALPMPVQACAVCFGKDAGQATDAINQAIFFMLGVISLVLTGIVSVAFTLMRRARRYEQEQEMLSQLQVKGAQHS